MGRLTPWAWTLTVAVAFLAGRTRPPRVEVVQEVREVPSAALVERVRELELEADGLRARLAGRQERPAPVVVRGTDPVPPPEACTVVTRVDASGVLATAPLFQLPGGQYRPEIREGIPVGDCDGGFSIGAGGDVVCDRARLGHLELFGAAAADWTPDGGVTVFPFLGVSWRPAYRSTWTATAGVEARPGSPALVRLEVRRGLRLF